MKKIAILIATTNGPVLVERITPEPAPQSMVCLSRQSTILPISADYEDFVRLGSGIIIREFPMEDDMSFRLDLSGDITSGKSWQLGFFAAHAVFHAPHLELSNLKEADEILWLSGTVDYDLNVGAVDHIAEKVEASLELLVASLSNKTPITFVLAQRNAMEVEDSAPPENITLRSVENAHEILTLLSVKSAKKKPRTKASKNTSTHPGFWIMAGIALGAVLVLFYLQDRPEEKVYLSPEPAPPAPIEGLSLDIYSNQGQSATYRFGDDLDLWVKTNKDAWLYCFYQQVDGAVLQIYPNASVRTPKVFQADTPHHLSGSRDADFVIRLGPPAGQETITCYASTQDLTLRLPKTLRGQSLDPLDPKTAGSLEGVFKTLRDVEWVRDQMEISLSP